MFAAGGTQLPNAGTVFATRTVIVSLAAGIIVTLLGEPRAGCARYARGADRRGPRRRDPPCGTAGARRQAVAIGVGVAGAGLLGVGLFASGLATGARLLLMAGGATLLFVGLTLSRSG